MKTDDLIEMLSRRIEPVPRTPAAARFARALLCGLPFAAVILHVGYGIRPDLSAVAADGMFWVKIGVPVAVAAAGLAVVGRVSRPGMVAGPAGLAALAPVLALWVLAAVVGFGLPEGERVPALLGRTWRSCVFSIGLIAAPMFVAAFQVLRTMAPTRPALAGAAAGWMAGGAGAAVYALHCPETAAPFLAVWYVLGMALPAGIGALLGPRLLRW